MPAKLGNSLGIIYDYSSSLHLHLASMLHTACSQLHTSTVLQARSSLFSVSTVLRVHVSEIKLVWTKCKVPLWLPFPHWV